MNNPRAVKIKQFPQVQPPSKFEEMSLERASNYRQIKELYLTLKIKNKKIKWPKGSSEEYKNELRRLRELESNAISKKKIKKKVPKKILSARIFEPEKKERRKFYRIAKKLAKKKKVKLSKSLIDKGTDEKFWRKEIRRLKKIKKKKPKIKSKTYTIKPTDIFNTFLVYDLIKKSKLKKNVRVLFYVNSTLIKEVIYPIVKGKNYSKQIYIDWTEGDYEKDNEALWTKYMGEKMKLIIQPNSKLTSRQIKQSFLDSKNYIDHCVFSPVKLWAETEMKNSNTVKTQQKYKTVINKCNTLMEEYKTGATVEQIQDFCDKIGVNICIDDVFVLNNRNISKTIIITSKKETRKTFKFINTRLNHLELSNIVSRKNEAIILNPYEMEQKYIELKANDITPIYFRNKDREFLWISTATEYFALENKTKIIYDKFYKKLEKTANIKALNLSINHSQPHSSLIRSAYHQTGHINFSKFDALTYDEKDELKYDRLDQIKAYASFNSCEYYQGFAFPLTEFRYVNIANVKDNKEFLKLHLGVFYIEDLQYTSEKLQSNSNVFDNEKFINIQKINEEINPYNIGSSSKNYINAFHSTELIFMIDCGWEFTIKYGAWSQKSFDFKFPKFMYGKECKGPSYYSKIVGSWGSFYDESTIELDGSKEWAENIKSLGYKTLYYEEIKDEDDNLISNESIKISFKKSDDQIKHKNYMAGAICAYQRITFMQQLYKIKYEDIYSIITDEIVVRKDSEQLYDKSIFKMKNCEGRIPQHSNNQFMSSPDITIQLPNPKSRILEVHSDAQNYCKYYRTSPAESFEFKSSRHHYPKEGKSEIMHIGPGGSGKTHNVLNDPGWINLLYIVPPHNVRNDKQLEFPDQKTEVLYNILNMPRMTEYQYGSEGRKVFIPYVIINDEATQTSKQERKKMKKTYPWATIIHCGDFHPDGWSYQLPNFTGDQAFTDMEEICIVEHHENYRAKDSDLKLFLNDYRKLMEEHYPWKTRKSKNKLIEFVMERINTISMDEVRDLYNIDDIVLVGTRKNYKLINKECKLDEEILIKEKYEYLKKIKKTKMNKKQKIKMINQMKRHINKTLLGISKDRKRRKNKRSGVEIWNKILGPKFKAESTYKYLVTKNNSKYYNGEIIISNKKLNREYLEERYAFTSHQIQGKTIKNKKIFIDIADFFSIFQMLYVAVSRPEYLNQLYIIEENNIYEEDDLCEEEQLDDMEHIKAEKERNKTKKILKDALDKAIKNGNQDSIKRIKKLCKKYNIEDSDSESDSDSDSTLSVMDWI